MTNGEEAASDPAGAQVKAAPSTRRSARSRKEPAASPRRRAVEAAAGKEAARGDEEGQRDKPDTLASAAEQLATQLGIVPPAGLNQALNAGGRASRAAVRTHRLIVEFHLGQLDRTLRAGRALTSCRSFDDALTVHRSFMQDMLRASADHLRQLTEIGLGTMAGEDPPRRRD